MQTREVESNVGGQLRKAAGKDKNIHRIMDSSDLPITKTYINLRIVTEEEARAKEIDLINIKELNNIAIEKEQDLYTDDQNGLKYLEKMLDPDATENESEIKKIVIYGKPGVGKSTVCQFISVTWQEKRLWNDKFNAVIWLRLKDLVDHEFARNTSQEVDLEDIAELIHAKYLVGAPSRKPSQKEVTRYLKSNGDKILFILDGYDEVKHILDESNHALRQVLNLIITDQQFYVIMTSRPVEIILNSNKAVQFDRRLESIGFTRENIKDYIKKFYSSETQTDLIKFLESTPSVYEIAQIPLNLDLICSLWSVEREIFQKESFSITMLYSKMTEKLLMYLEQRASWSKENEPERARRKEILINLLEKVGLCCMLNNRTIIQLSKLRDIITKAEEDHNVTNLVGELINIGVLKIIQENKELWDNKVYFIHQTFQEYFAARAIATGFELDEVVVIKILRTHKYEAYYERVWINAAATLYERCKSNHNFTSLVKFWDTFENEPRELLGKRHGALAMKLLEATKVDDEEVPQALKALRNRIINSKAFVRKLLEIISNIESGPILRVQAIETLVKMQSTTDEVFACLEKIVAEEQVEAVRLYAAEAILRLGQDSLQSVKILTDKLKEINHNDKLTQYTVLALGRIGRNIPQIARALRQLIRFEGRLKSEIDIMASESLIKIKKTGIQDCVKFIVSFLTDNAIKDFAINTLALHKQNGEVQSVLKEQLDSNIMQDIMNATPSEHNYTALALDKYQKVDPSIFEGAATSVFFGNIYVGMQVIRLVSFSILLTLSPKSILGLSWTRTHSISRVLDDIVQKGASEVFEKIIMRVNDNSSTILKWSKEGILDLALAIRLYSFSSQAAWLEPMRDINFIFKNPSLFLTIEDWKILDEHKQELTKNKQESLAVLKAMHIAYTKAELPTNVLDHYLHGTCLNVSDQQQRNSFLVTNILSPKKIIAHRPMVLTELHKAAQAGDLNKVQAIITEGTINIDNYDNLEGATPLILAVKGKHWEVVKVLVAHGADVNLGSAINVAYTHTAGSEIINLLVNESFLKETLLHKALTQASSDYKLQKTPDTKVEVINRLVKCVTGDDRSWQNSGEKTDLYHMYLGNIQSMTRDRVGRINPEGLAAYEILQIRLHIYLELFVKLSNNQIDDLPAIKGATLSVDMALRKIYEEIRLLTETYITVKVLAELLGNTTLKNSYVEKIMSHISKLEEGREYVISSGFEGHAIYVAFYKCSKDGVLLRIDNRSLTGSGVDRNKHGNEPWRIRRGMEEKIKSYCVGIFNLGNKNEREYLLSYIKEILNYQRGSREQLQYIYGKDLPQTVILYERMAEDVLSSIGKWPYHTIQGAKTNNCTLSSYNLGISVRQGMEFFEWLIGKEQQLAPPLTTIERTAQTVTRSTHNTARGANNDNTHSYTNDALMKRFQQVLKVDSAAVRIGIAVEQSLVGLAGITTIQTGATFRRHDATHTIFRLNLLNLTEMEKFVGYYNGRFPGIIQGTPTAEKGGKVAVIMNTRMLYNQVAGVLSELSQAPLKKGFNL